MSASLPSFESERYSSLSIEQIGDEIVVFDPVRMHYHHLNQSAAAIWQICEGASDPATAATLAQASLPDLPVERIMQTIDELTELGLLSWRQDHARRHISRRDAVKIGLAAATGVVGLPVIVSITVPSSQAAASGSCGDGLTCSPSGICCGPHACVGVGNCQSNTDCGPGMKCLNGACYRAC